MYMQQIVKTRKIVTPNMRAEDDRMFYNAHILRILRRSKSNNKPLPHRTYYARILSE